MFLYALQEPILGQTHAQVAWITVHPGQKIEIRGRLGTLAESAFVPERRLQGLPFQRIIRGAELDAFFQRVIDEGLPEQFRGNFRNEDLVWWFDTYGFEGSTWEAE